MRQKVDRLWEFWYRATPDSEPIIYGTKFCRMPSTTAMWRMLSSKAYYDNLHQWGYNIAEVQPKSKNYTP